MALFTTPSPFIFVTPEHYHTIQASYMFPQLYPYSQQNVFLINLLWFLKIKLNSLDLKLFGTCMFSVMKLIVWNKTESEVPVIILHVNMLCWQLKKDKQSEWFSSIRKVSYSARIHVIQTYLTPLKQTMQTLVEVWGWQLPCCIQSRPGFNTDNSWYKIIQRSVFW